MNAWLNDASSLSGQDNVAFNPSTIDPSSFLHNSPTTQDPNQFQRMFNGVPRNASPGFHNPNSVIPSKRARPEDGMPMSPRPAPGGMPGSRSQTPQMPFPGYQGSSNGTPQFSQHPNQYHHLQQGASPNVTQSPIMNEFDQQSVRMGTASPSPFSPQVGGHMSPSQSDHSSRVNTPQNNNFMPGQAFSQSMGPSGLQHVVGMSSAAQQPSMQAQFNGQQQVQVPLTYHQALATQQQRLHAMQVQQNQNRQMNVNGQMTGRTVAGMNSMANPQQMAAIRQMQANMAKPSNPEGFIRSLQKFMMSRNLPLDLNPVVCGRPISLIQLYGTVIKMGGSKKVTASNLWSVVAQQLQFAQVQFPMAAQELREQHQRNLGQYEQAFISSQQHQKQMENQQQQQGGLSRQPSDPSLVQYQSPSIKPGQNFEQPQPLALSPQTNIPVSNQSHSAQINGFATPTQVRSQSRPPQSAHRLSVSRQSQPPIPQTDISGQFAAPSPQGKSITAPPVQQPVEQKVEKFVKKPIEDPFKPMLLSEPRPHGPILVDEMYQLGEDIIRLKPSVPSFGELGVIDIHALTMGLKSGIQGEIRVALDTLTTLSVEPAVQLSLENCDDLVESLVDCAQDQTEYLMEHIPVVSDVIQLKTYEEVTRGCQAEFTSLVDVHEFASVPYNLDRAVDRLICITTILRNFSFSEANFPILGMPPVTQMFADVFRCIGTRDKFLRTNQNTMEFMKDAVVFMGNLAHLMQIPGKEEALSLLHFLLAFAPMPGPILKPDQVMFTLYNPLVHRYTPSAADGLAKLLARDDPNRIYLSAIFSGDGAAPPQPDLLTRAFGLAICCVPERKQLATTDARKVFLMQGLLAADVLTTFADGHLAKLWLGSVDGFAIHLLRLSCLLCTERIPQINQMRQRSQVDAEALAYGSIIHRGLAILRRLAEKSKQVDHISPLRLPSGIVPRKESLLGALLLPHMDPNIIRQLITYARLAE